MHSSSVVQRPASRSFRARVLLAMLACASPLALAARPAHAQTVPTDFVGSSVTTGLSGPTCMAVAPDGSVYIAQQGGALRVWSSATSTLSTIKAFTVDSTGERGLIGVALDPDFTTNRFVYVHFTTNVAPVHNTIHRITLDAAGTAMVADSEITLLDLDNLSGATNHNGGAIHFGPDGKLYIAVGENATGSNAQSIANLKGKMLRINTDPANVIPTDNPTSFAGITGTPTGNNRAIWAVGLRNPFTFAFQPGTGRMFINDVGSGTWEEINDGIAGRNYGWPGTEGPFTQASFPNFTHPLVAYRHSNGALNYPTAIGNFTGIVVAGGAFYNPTRPNFPIAFRNQYFFGDYFTDIIRTFDPAANAGEGFATAADGVIDLALAPNGTLLYLSRTSSQGLRRITYTGTSGVCCVSNVCSLSNGISCAGTFIWGTVTCSADPCAPPPPLTGACCDGVLCSVTTAAACAGAGKHYSGNATICNIAGNNTTPCCRADFDQSGTVMIDDIFIYLNLWFAGC